MKKIENVFDFVVEMIVDITGEQKEKITPQTKIEEICKDSIQLFSLIMAIEKELNAQVAYNDLICIETVEDAVLFIEKLIHK